MQSLSDFLIANEEEILFLTEKKTLELAGDLSSSDQLKQGLPLFFQQLLGILNLERPAIDTPAKNKKASADAASQSDEFTNAIASGKPEEAQVAKTAALHGTEMLRLDYTLSHVVHAYGAMCQAITELAEKKKVAIDVSAFHDLNQCLDVAIAGAVTEYQKLRDTAEKKREDKHLGFLTHEMRNALTSATLSLQLIKKGTVGITGSTGRVLERSLQRMQELIDRSLTEMRLRIDPEVHIEASRLLLIADQILVTAQIEAESKNQKITLKIDPSLTIEVDEQAFYSALSNLVQNAIKFTRNGGTIQIRGYVAEENVIVEVEDECGGLTESSVTHLFIAFTQQNKDRTGLGLGLSIAEQAIALNRGTIEVRNLIGKGCVFKITLPKIQTQGNGPGLKSISPDDSQLKEVSSEPFLKVT